MDTSINIAGHMVDASGKSAQSGIVSICGTTSSCVPITHAFTPKFVLEVKDLGVGVVSDISITLHLIPKVKRSSTKSYQQMIADVNNFKFNVNKNDDLFTELDRFNELFISSSWRHRYVNPSVESAFYRKDFAKRGLNYDAQLKKLDVNMGILLKSKHMSDTIDKVTSFETILGDASLEDYKNTDHIVETYWDSSKFSFDDHFKLLKKVFLDLDLARIYIDVELMFITPPAPSDDDDMENIHRCVISPLTPYLSGKHVSSRYHIKLSSAYLATYPCLFVIPSGVKVENYNSYMETNTVRLPSGNIMWDGHGSEKEHNHLPVAWYHRFPPKFVDNKWETSEGVCYEVCPKRSLSFLHFTTNEVFLLNHLLQAMVIAVNAERTEVASIILTPCPMFIPKHHVASSKNQVILKFALSLLFDLLQSNDLSEYGSYYKEIRTVNERSMWCVFNKIFCEHSTKCKPITYGVFNGQECVVLPKLHAIYENRLCYSDQVYRHAHAVRLTSEERRARYMLKALYGGVEMVVDEFIVENKADIILMMNLFADRFKKNVNELLLEYAYYSIEQDANDDIAAIKQAAADRAAAASVEFKINQKCMLEYIKIVEGFSKK